MLIILSISFISASFDVGNLSHSIQKSYGPSDYIKGWINISLDGESVNSLFKTNGNSRSLIDLLEINKAKEYSGFDDFSCSPLSCETDYSASNPETEKTFNLTQGGSIIFGFNFMGNIISVNSINFELESDVGLSCYNQLKIDFLSDEKIDIANNKILDSHCISGLDYLLKSYGCFNKSEEIKDRAIYEIPYCQRIKLSESPGFWLGVNITNTSSKSEDDELTMELYDSSGNSIKNCELTIDEISEEWKEVSCDIDYLVTKQEDYYICIYSNQEASENYTIKGSKNPSIKCGFYGPPIKLETSAYQIFAEGKKFGAVGTLEITNSLPNEDETLGLKVQEYLMRLYYNYAEGYIDCSTGCVVPIEFISGNLAQMITMRGLTISYEDDGGPAWEDEFYNLSSTTAATINANFQKIYLDEGNFSVPSTFGNYTFSLSLGGESIFSETLFIGGIPIIESVKPRTTASAYPTEFEVTVKSDRNILKYDWDFGNGDTETTTTNKIIYTYNSTGPYELRINVTDSSQSSSSKEFEIDVGSPEEIINRLLAQMLTNLNKIKTQIDEFSSFYQDSLKSILDVDALDNKLTEIYTANRSASDESDYNLILTDLLYLEIPESVSISASADSISFYSKEENINLDVLKIIGGGDYDESDASKYVDAIIGWNQKNMETQITFNELSAKYEYSEKPVLKIFELKINENPSRGNSYLIIPKFDNLKFKEDYSEEEKEEYFYIDLTDSQKTITFSTTEDINFMNLPVFISPAISELSITEGPDEKDEALSEMALFILIISLLAIIGVVVYVILQGWYKKKYEDYLFKNRNELYNLISYIQSSKKKGLENKKIIVKLKKAGWKYEQITYIMRKYAGERTGMFEIPIGKILSKFKKKEVKSMPQRKPIGNFSRPKNFTPNFNPRRNKKRFL